MNESMPIEETLASFPQEYSTLGGEKDIPETTGLLSEDELDNLVDSRFDTDVRGVQLMEQLVLARGQNNTQNEAAVVSDIRALRQEIAEVIRSELGERTETEITAAGEAQRATYVKGILQTVAPDDDEAAVLMKLGMLDAENRFNFDKRLFSEKTGELWDAYLLLVRTFDELSREAKEVGAQRPEIVSIDHRRVQAHDTLTRSVMEDLFLSGSEEEFQQTRKLVAKMRDSKYPGTGETGVASRLARALLNHARLDVDALDL